MIDTPKTDRETSGSESRLTRRLLWAIALVGLSLCLVWLFDFNPIGANVEAYRLHRDCRGADPCQYATAPVLTFRADFDSQRVFLRFENGRVHQLRECVVQGRRDWSCNLYQMSGGQIVEPEGSYFKEVSRRAWLYAKYIQGI